MRDFLISDELLVSLCMATNNDKSSIPRIGTRLYEDQSRYDLDSFGKVGEEIRKFAKYGNKLVDNDKEVSKMKSGIYRSRVKNNYQGNYSVYKLTELLLRDIMDDRFRDKANKFRYKREFDRFGMIMRSIYNRTGIDLDYNEQRIIDNNTESVRKAFSKMSATYIAIEDLVYKRVEEHNRMISSKDFSYKSRKAFPELKTLDMVIVGSIRAFMHKDNVFLMSNNHYSRFMDFWMSLTNMIFIGKDCPVLISPDRIPLKLVEICSVVFNEDSNAVGEALKASRQLAILELEKSNIMGNSRSLYAEAIDSTRLERAEKMLTLAKSFTTSKLTMVNILGFYTSIPHPDSPIHDMFESIYGVKDPNPVDSSFYSRLEGVLRRSIYSSLRDSLHDVRLKSKSSLGEELSQESNLPSRPKEALLSKSSVKWSETTFEVVRTLPKLHEMDVPIASKASSAGIIMTTTEEQQAKAYFAGYGKTISEKFYKPSSVNDATSYIRGNCSLNIDRALRRFDRITDMHERFESRYRNLSIDEIPSSELETFLKQHPMAQYVVNTEGKFGEVHKVVTRLFYMAEQELKALTQRVERLAKQVSRKQKGVSIVKSFLGRRSDLERCIANMTGKFYDVRSVAVSFDMSEFSKKFPMSLVRLYGRILGELIGDSSLERIDLFFRASKVNYSNRGYYNDIRGAKGGFEGFLNFVWSSLHSAIMEVALETTGLRGELLTFSDDGLLIFYPQRDIEDEKITVLLKKVQETYKKLGLNFHLGKTMVSDHMWEYLGDVCHDNKLIPTWVKEMSKLGRDNTTKGFTPFYDRISAYDAQGAAMVVSSGDPITASFLKRFHCGRLLRKWLNGKDFLLEELLLRLPTSCGGLRVSSPFEDCCQATITSDEEIYTDILLLEDLSPGFSGKVLSIILRNVKDNSYSSALSILQNMSFFKTTLPDTSGNRQISMLLTNIRNVTGFVSPESPLTESNASDIYDILKTAKNIDLKSIKRLLDSIPGLSEYRSYIGVLKGSGALKILPRKYLRAAQKSNTVDLKNSINYWDNALKNAKDDYRSNYLDVLKSYVFPNLDIGIPRLTPRLYLKLNTKGSMQSVEVTIQGSSDSNIYDANYIEPSLKSFLENNTLNWNSELTGDLQKKDVRKFLNAVHSIISGNPNSEKVIRNICEIIGYVPPRMYAGIVSGAHRTKKGLYSVSPSRLILPRYHMSKMKTRYLNAFLSFTARDIRMDRTTAKVSAEVLSYFYHTIENKLSGRQHSEPSFYRFDILVKHELWNRYFSTVEMTDTDITPKPPEQSNLPNYIIDEYVAVSSERESLIKQTEILNFEKTMSEKEEDDARDLYLSSMISKVSAYLTSVYQRKSSTILTESDIPNMTRLRGYIIKRAIISAAINLFDRKSRDSLSRICHRLKLEDEMDEDSIEDSSEWKIIESFIELISDLYLLIPDSLRTMTREISRVFFDENRLEVLKLLSEEFFKYTMMSEEKVTIFFTKGSSSKEFTPQQQAVVRKMFRETVKGLFAMYHKCNWNSKTVVERYPEFGGRNVDEVIDCLKVFYNIIRSSKHRNDPYNSKSAIGELNKFYYLVAEMYQEVDNIKYDKEILRYRTKKENKELLKRYLQEKFTEWKLDKYSINLIITRQSGNVWGFEGNKGEDLIRNLERKIERNLLFRAIWYASDYFYTGQMKDPAVNWDYTIDKGTIKLIQTSFHELILTRVFSKIKHYEHSIRGIALSEFQNFSNRPEISTGITTSHRKVCGYDIYSDLICDHISAGIIGHLRLISINYGHLGFYSYGKDKMSGIINTTFNVRTHTAVPTVGRDPSKDSFVIAAYACKGIRRALSTYIYLSSGSQSSISILKSDESINMLLGQSNRMPGLEEVDLVSLTTFGERTRYAKRGSFASIEEEDHDMEDEDGSEHEGDVDESETNEVFDEYGNSLLWEEYGYNEYLSEDEEGLDPVPDDNNLYIVYGITNLTTVEQDEEVVPEVKAKITTELSSIVDNLNFDDSLQELQSQISSLSSNSTQLNIGRQAFIQSATSEFLYNIGRQVNNSSESLQACIVLGKSTQNHCNIEGSHFLMYYFLNRYRFGLDFKLALSEIHEFKRENAHTYMMSLGVVKSWVNSVDIQMGESLSNEKVKKLAKFARRIFNGSTSHPYEINTMSIVDNIKSIMDKTSINGKFKVGTFQEYLYMQVEEDPFDEMLFENVSNDDEINEDEIFNEFLNSGILDGLGDTTFI